MKKIIFTGIISPLLLIIVFSFSANASVVVCGNPPYPANGFCAGSEVIVLHPVRAGDTLESIASFYGTTAQKIMELNGLSSASLEGVWSIRVPATRNYEIENRLKSRWGPQGILDAPCPYWDIIVRECARNGVKNPVWICAIIKQESGFRKSAVGGDGECGLAQLMPFNVRGYGYHYYSSEAAGAGDPLSCFVPENNIKMGVQYFAGCLKRCGNNYFCASQCYNGGPGGIGKARPTRYASNVNAIFNSLQSRIG
jgi:soluble lytic murein transglycosylase-like protein